MPSARYGPTPPDRVPVPEDELRGLAVARLREKRDFKRHLAIYLAVNLLLVVLWATDSPRDFFWPLFPLFGWGIGLSAHAWAVYRGTHFSEDRIRREMDRLRGDS